MTEPRKISSDTMQVAVVALFWVLFTAFLLAYGHAQEISDRARAAKFAIEAGVLERGGK